MNQEWTFAVTQVLSVIQPSEIKFFEEAVMCKEKFVDKIVISFCESNTRGARESYRRSM